MSDFDAMHETPPGMEADEDTRPAERADTENFVPAAPEGYELPEDWSREDVPEEIAC